MYQEFYNWGAPGQIFEAVVQRVEDPDGKALTSSFVYWDQTTQPGNLLYQATYPDGFSERIPNRISGDGFTPAVSRGGELRHEQPFKDNDAGSSGGRVTGTSYSALSSVLLLETTTNMINGQLVGYRETYHDFSVDGFWGKITYDYVDDSSGQYASEEEWQDLTSRRTSERGKGVGKGS